jgi:UV DNA damage repair endonuclease
MSNWLVQLLEIAASLLPMINWADLVPANLASHIAQIASSLASIIGELVSSISLRTAPAPAPVKMAAA